MKIISKSFLACLTLATVALLPIVSNAQSDEVVGTQYVCEDAFLFIHIQPAKMLELASDDAADDLEYLTGKLGESVAIDPKTIDRVLVQVCTNVDFDDDDEAMLVCVHSTEAFDLDHMETAIAEAGGECERGEIAGRECLTFDEYSPSIAIADENTLLIGFDGRLEASFDDEADRTDATRIAQGLDATTHLSIAFEVGDDEHRQEKVEEFLESISEGLGVDAPAADEIVSGSVNVTLDQDQPLAISVETTNEEAAAMLVELGDEILTQISNQAEQMEAMLDGGGGGFPIPEETKSSIEAGLKFMNAIVETGDVSAEGNTVSATMEIEGGFPQAVDATITTWASRYRMFERFEGMGMEMEVDPPGFEDEDEEGFMDDSDVEFDDDSEMEDDFEDDEDDFDEMDE